MSVWAWAEGRETTKPEDRAYALLGIFDVFMPLIYGEGGDEAFRRFLQEINRARNQYEDFLVTFSLSGAPKTDHFVGRTDELLEIHARLAVVPNGLGGIGKTQLAIEYAK
ncbi:hypothetical protein F4810DRAFT_707957 [Camillea tinctor]|nr:hypothetical protein F4810DRAFT_707957 [Camillea tinctor]